MLVLGIKEVQRQAAQLQQGINKAQTNSQLHLWFWLSERKRRMLKKQKPTAEDGYLHSLLLLNISK